jgi:magnesium transporter
VDGIQKETVEKVCHHFGIHPLLAEDILSLNQRPKMDEVDNVLYCLLNMLYYNEQKQSVEQEQVSIVLVKILLSPFRKIRTVMYLTRSVKGEVAQQ